MVGRNGAALPARRSEPTGVSAAGSTTPATRPIETETACAKPASGMRFQRRWIYIVAGSVNLRFGHKVGSLTILES